MMFFSNVEKDWSGVAIERLPIAPEALRFPILASRLPLFVIRHTVLVRGRIEIIAGLVTCVRRWRYRRQDPQLGVDRTDRQAQSRKTSGKNGGACQAQDSSGRQRPRSSYARRDRPGRETAERRNTLKGQG